MNECKPCNYTSQFTINLDHHSLHEEKREDRIVEFGGDGEF